MPSESDITRVVDQGLEDLEQGEAEATRRMLTAYETAYHNVQRDLEDVMSTIEQARADGVDVNPDWLRRQGRYLQLLDSIDREYRAAAVRAGFIVEGLQLESADGGGALARRQLGMMVTDPPNGVSMERASVPRVALERWASATALDSPLRPVLDRFGPSTASIIEDAITEGMASGYGAAEIVRQIEQRAGSSGRRYELERIVRTESMTAFRGSQMDQYREVEHLLQGAMWMSTLSIRTCLFCLSMHGKIFALDTFPDHEHPLCRCTRTPIPRKIYGPGLANTDGEAWIREQPQSTQRMMLGGNELALNAWNARALSLTDFVGLNHSPEWGYSGFQRSGRMALLNAGLPTS